MKNSIYLVLLLLFPFLLNAQSNPKKLDTENKVSIRQILNESITAEELSAQLHFIASDFFQGRKAGTSAERAVAHYLASYYKGHGIPPLNGSVTSNLDAYFQPFEISIPNNNGKSQNVLAFIEGTQLKDEVVILVAHYDHLGADASLAGDSVFNGAADDASGTVALMELAEAFLDAKEQGLSTNRSILFLHAGAEEIGVLGSNFFVRNSPVPLEKIVAVVNLDGVGGSDKPGADNASNYVYLLHNDSTSQPLAELTKHLNSSYEIGLDILNPHNPERYNSDHKPFEYELIPFIYFSSGLTEYYHKVSDEAETIDYDHMTKIVKLIFASSWHLSNDQIEQGRILRSQFKKTGAYYCVPCGCASDSKEFTSDGSCPDCHMVLQPKWVKSD
ncbi:M28 family peptidase [Fulvivirga imtechensis]|nr:M28 family peptidase [Fulvivirga imtechensis]